jgi:hypothetical protein
MPRLVKYFTLLCLGLFILNGVAMAQELNRVTDEFYSGLAGVIERNMHDPESCVREVGNYFEANRDKVEFIRKEAAKAMEMIAPEIDKYMSMTEEEAAAMAQQQERMQANRSEPRMSAAAQRYNEVFKAFCSQYPKYGMKIAGKTMQLVPGFSGGTTQTGQGSDF